MGPKPGLRVRRPRSVAVISRSVAICITLTALQPILASGEVGHARHGETGSKQGAHSVAADISLPAAVPYADCTGATPLDQNAIYRDRCLPGLYLLAHNPGPFTELLSLRAGSRVEYQGRLFTITSVSLMTAPAQWDEAQRHPAALTLQTCVNDALSRVWVFKGRPASL
jgi:hypothetical protein